MAKTAFSTDDLETKEIWEEKLFRDTFKESWWGPRLGGAEDDMDALVHVKTELEREQGDRITYALVPRLKGAGVTSGQQLEGNEEGLDKQNFQLVLEEYAHAVRDRGPLDRQRAMFSIDKESLAMLKGWQSEKIDELAFDAIQDTPTRVFYALTSNAGATPYATAKAALATNDLITPKQISRIRAFAKVGGKDSSGNRIQTPLRMVRFNNRNYYVLLVGENTKYDLSIDSTFTQAMREAWWRDEENLLFRDADLVWNGVIVTSHENIAYGEDGGGSTVKWESNMFLGAQSLAWGWGSRPKIVTDEFDYGREHGFSTQMISGVAKPQFSDKDYGSLMLLNAVTGVTGG